MKTGPRTLRMFITENLLDQRHIAQARSHLQLAPFNLHHALWQALKDSQSAAQVGGQQLDVRLNAHLTQVLADRARLEGVFRLLLQLAIDSHKPGAILVVGSENRAQKVVVSICDPRAGIPLNVADTDWAQAGATGSGAQERFGGGLELTAAMVTVAAHQGQLSLHRTRPGPGCFLSVSLPLTEGGPLS